MCGSFAEKGEAELIATFHPELAKQVQSLESKYGGRWSNTSITGALKQTRRCDCTSKQLDNLTSLNFEGKATN